MGFRRSSNQQLQASPEMADESISQAPEWKPSTQELMIMGVLSVISLMTALDATIIVTSVNAMVTDLHATTTQGIWIGTSYLLATGVAMPILASISDIFGRPTLLVFSVAMFTVGTIVCVSSHTIAQLLTGRSIQGVGGGGIVVLSLVIFTDIVPLRHRPKWYSIVQGAWALGTCIGPVLGGAIAQHTTWRWVFYTMLPFCVFGLISIPLLLTIKPRVETMGEKLKRIDWIGMVVFMGSATSFLIAISWGGTQFAWDSAETLLPLIIGAVGLATGVVWQVYGAKEPFMRHELLNNLSAIATYICAAVQGLILFGQLYYIPFYFMAVLAYTPINTGAALVPVTITLVPASIVTGNLISRYNSYRWPIWAGWAFCTIACGLTTIWDRDTHVVVWVITLVILGFGHGMILNAQNFAAQAICGPGDEANAASMYAFMRHFGTALGVGIGGTTFQNVMKLKLGWLGLSTAIASDAEGYLPRLLAMPATAEKAETIAAYAYGCQGVFRVYLALSGVAFFLTLVVKHFDLNKELRTEHTLQENRVSVFMKNRASRVGSALDGTVLVAPDLLRSQSSDASSFTAVDGSQTPQKVSGHKKSLSGGVPKVSFADIERPATSLSKTKGGDA